MTLAHRQPGESSNATSGWIQPFAARHTERAAGLPSTKARRLILPTRSQRSAPAISEAAFSFCELTDLGLRFCRQRNLSLCGPWRNYPRRCSYDESTIFNDPRIDGV